MNILLLIILLLAILLLYQRSKITNLKQDIAHNMRRFELALEGSKTTFWNWSAKESIIQSEYGEAWGCSKYHQDIHRDDYAKLKTAFNQYLQGEIDNYEVEYRTKSSDEQWRWKLARGVAVSYDRYKHPDYIVGISIDITKRKLRELKLQELSYRDSLTGLYNRSYFDKKIKELNQKKFLPLSIVVGDLNDLKFTNDQYGHAVGDKILASTGKLLQEISRKDDIITRWGGDEFVMLLPNTNKDEALQLCARICASCENLEGCSIRPNMSLGVATKTHMEEDIEQVLRKADQWMYHNKWKRVSSVPIFVTSPD